MIQELIPARQWQHFNSNDNPADCASRGWSPTKLPTHFSCWSGPMRLKFDSLTAEELHTALFMLVISVQCDSFTAEVQCLKNGKPLPEKSPTVSLTLFINEYRVLRIGGYFHKAEIPEHHKHPALLQNSKLTELTIMHGLLMNLH
ncbi:hypothetical protein PR048_028623 [Dryococelus australis]|uniref:Uncharacterized protein n=1 Tax=Dryococelus australis TaxID=614101 RepID=A0ABQ9GB39_9NEOP|nr:hypothetical protein PR048_028623 [Dryococelus australis]